MRPDVVALPHGRRLVFDKPLVMGIVNATPDSFSDGGRYLDPDAAVSHGRLLIEQGADIIDVGGESTRPGASLVDHAEESRRVRPVIAALASSAAPISIDTTKSRIAAEAVSAGACIVNDVWALSKDPDMGRVVAETGAYVVLMHNRETVDEAVDIVAEVRDFLSRAIERALAAGVAAERIAVDPGFGFGKSHAQSLTLVRELGRLRELGFRVLLGVSRKRAIGWATGRKQPSQRLAGSLACALSGVERGADIVRVHDVAEHVDAISIWSVLARGVSTS